MCRIKFKLVLRCLSVLLTILSVSSTTSPVEKSNELFKEQRHRRSDPVPTSKIKYATISEIRIKNVEGDIKSQVSPMNRHEKATTSDQPITPLSTSTTSAPGFTDQNQTRHISPIVLDMLWNKSGRLTAFIVLSTLGIINTLVFITAFFFDDLLSRISNVFLAYTGFCDMIVTAGILPISTIALMFDNGDSIPLCHLLHFMAVVSTYTYSFLCSLIALEIYLRLCASSEAYYKLTRRLKPLIILVFCVGCVIAYLDVYKEMDYDYCERKHHGNIYYRLTTTIVCHVIPFLSVLYAFATEVTHIQRRGCSSLSYKLSQQYTQDLTLVYIKAIGYLAFVISWLQYLVISFCFPDTTDEKYYFSAWAGLSRAIISSLIYGRATSAFARLRRRQDA